MMLRFANVHVLLVALDAYIAENVWLPVLRPEATYVALAWIGWGLLNELFDCDANSSDVVVPAVALPVPLVELKLM
jgi:hypothetical protein